MKNATYRTTFALDEATSRRLSRLAASWQVSRAEVVRRAVAMAESGTAGGSDPTVLLRELQHSGKALARETAEAYLAEVRTARRHWRGEA